MYVRWLLGWRYISSLHSADELQQGRTAVHCCDPTSSVLIMLMCRHVFHVVSALQSVVVTILRKKKKMATVHFNTMPCEPNTACKVQGKPHFCSIFSCAIGIRCTPGVKVLDVFISFRALRIMGKCTNRHLLPTADYA